MPERTKGPIVFVVVVFGGLGSLTGCFIASLLMGLIQTFAVVLDYSVADLLRWFGLTITTSSTPATLAGIAFMSTEEGYAALPPGT